MRTARKITLTIELVFEDDTVTEACLHRVADKATSDLVMRLVNPKMVYDVDHMVTDSDVFDKAPGLDYTLVEFRGCMDSAEMDPKWFPEAFASVDEARKQGCCARCGDKLDFTDWAPIDLREYNASGIGPCCFWKYASKR